MSDFDIIVTKGNRRTVGLLGRVIKPTVAGVSAQLENGEELSLKSAEYDYISEYDDAQGWSDEYGVVHDEKKIKEKVHNRKTRCNN